MGEPSEPSEPSGCSSASFELGVCPEVPVSSAGRYLGAPRRLREPLSAAFAPAKPLSRSALEMFSPSCTAWTNSWSLDTSSLCSNCASRRRITSCTNNARSRLRNSSSFARPPYASDEGPLEAPPRPAPEPSPAFFAVDEDAPPLFDLGASCLFKVVNSSGLPRSKPSTPNSCRTNDAKFECLNVFGKYSDSNTSGFQTVNVRPFSFHAMTSFDCSSVTKFHVFLEERKKSTTTRQCDARGDVRVKKRASPSRRAPFAPFSIRASWIIERVRR
ncbi:hypothetical protein BE221DRAFT_77859 [Ostreococcus tauri]|uniref:Uncharacterized protein n=1 Tax=Ostreococcus tauri TaxID=70448 RepID=A0A1Y5I5N4_OSTTA|nr:hypothetical protein BE221DRAFT_77859 [Ostreococcus tauri]